jgi:hypothetical protein
MEKLEVIKAAHLIDQYLEALSVAVTEEVLRKKLAAVRIEWQELAYSITAHVCGVETKTFLSITKKKASKRRAEDMVGQGDQVPGDLTRPAPDADTSRLPGHAKTAGQF